MHIEHRSISTGTSISLILQEAPAPGSYDVQKSFAKSQGKREYMPPRNAMAKRRHASFLSGTPREDLPKVKAPGMLTKYVSKEAKTAKELGRRN